MSSSKDDKTIVVKVEGWLNEVKGGVRYLGNAHVGLKNSCGK